MGVGFRWAGSRCQLCQGLSAMVYLLIGDKSWETWDYLTLWLRSVSATCPAEAGDEVRDERALFCLNLKKKPFPCAPFVALAGLCGGSGCGLQRWDLSVELEPAKKCLPSICKCVWQEHLTRSRDTGQG